MFKSWRYQSVPSSPSSVSVSVSEADDLSETKPTWASETSTHACNYNNRRRSYLRNIVPWIISNVLFAIIAIYFTVQNYAQPEPEALRLGPFKTDFHDAKSWVNYEERVFTGMLRYNTTTRKPYLGIDPSEPQYVGEPGPELDATWNDLLRDEIIELSEEEASQFTPAMRPFPDSGKYYATLGTFHSLHCLSILRHALNRQLYPSSPEVQEKKASNVEWERLHLGHCMEQLRQTVQCYGDLSPVPIYWWPGFNLAFGAGTAHTCRKWDQIRQYVGQRDSGPSPDVIF